MLWFMSVMSSYLMFKVKFLVIVILLPSTPLPLLVAVTVKLYVPIKAVVEVQDKVHLWIPSATLLVAEEIVNPVG